MKSLSRAEYFLVWTALLVVALARVERAAAASEACLPAPEGLVSWWTLDDGAADFTGRNPATALGTHRWAVGWVGGALYFDGTHDEVSAYGPMLDVGAGPGFTLEGWIKTYSVTNPQPILEWNTRRGLAGVHFWLAQPPPLGSGRGSLYANLIDGQGVSHILATAPGHLEAGPWYHVALTYDKASGLAALYSDGVQRARTNLGTFRPQTGSDYELFFGRRAAAQGYEYRFAGAMDEVSLYGRALSAAEIGSLQQAGTNGKCRVAFLPEILAGPQSQSLSWNTDLALGVTAVGTPPLHYQWLFNGIPLEGATDLHLTLTQIQPAQGGNYAVAITNAGGAITSAVAVVEVKPPPTLLRSVADIGLSEGILTLTVEVEAQGFERILEFNVGFPASWLSYRAAILAAGLPPGTRLSAVTNDLAAGRVGIGITLPEGLTLTATRHTLAILKFKVAPVTNEIPVGFTFEAGPMAPRVAGVSGDALLVSTTSAATVLSSSRLEVVSVGADPGAMVEVPLRHYSIGRENALGLTVSFPAEQLHFVSASTHPALLMVTNTARIAQGQLGLAALDSDLTIAFPRGTNDLFRLKFLVSKQAAGSVLPVRLTDAVLPREFSDTNSTPFPGVFQDGTIRVAGVAYEADVAPGGGGDGAMRAQDWARLGRVVAGLETMEEGRFAQADCAPRETKGDGLLSLIDWVQAGRYYFGLDRLRQVGGPGRAIPAESVPAVAPSSSGARVVLETTNVATGGLVRVRLRWVGVGDENAVGFSLHFDPAQVRFVNATPVTGLPEVYLQRNTNRAPEGIVGLMAALEPGQAFGAGERDLLWLSFRATEDATGAASISFADQPVKCEVADVQAHAVPSMFTGGAMQIDPIVASSKRTSGPAP